MAGPPVQPPFALFFDLCVAPRLTGEYISLDDLQPKDRIYFPIRLRNSAQL